MSSERKEMENTILKISQYSAKYFKIDENSLYNRCVDRTLTLARHIAWYILHVDYGIPTSILSKRFHRTRRHIFYGINKIRCGIEKQKFYKTIYKDLLDFMKLDKTCPI